MKLKIVNSTLVTIIVILFLLPILSIFILSIIDMNRLTLSYNQYYLLFKENLEFFYLYFQSLVVTLTIVIGQLLISIMISYYFARSSSIFSRLLFFTYVFLMILPLQVMLIPTTLLYSQIESVLHFKIFDTQMAVILPGLFSTISVFILKQYFSSLPEEYFENAKIDGASNFDILIKIVLPIAKYAILVVGLVLFLEYWNMIEQGLIFMNSSNKIPISLYLNSISYSGKPYLFACVVFYLVPIIVFIRLTYKIAIIKYKEFQDVEKSHIENRE